MTFLLINYTFLILIIYVNALVILNPLILYIKIVFILREDIMGPTEHVRVVTMVTHES